MDVLIIGNGFDIANGLPTKYSDFLKLLETKDRFIDSNSNLTQDQKDEIKNFFNKHPNYLYILYYNPSCFSKGFLLFLMNLS